MTRSTTSFALAGLLAAFACSSEPGSGATRTDASGKIATISHGESVTLTDHLVAGQRTLFEYTADW